MKISQLIKELQTALRKYGDIPVDMDAGCCLSKIEKLKAQEQCSSVKLQPPDRGAKLQPNGKYRLYLSS
jgi:hypothetical protein